MSDTIKRYDFGIEYEYGHASVEVCEGESGGYVEFEDCKTLLDRIADLERRNGELEKTSRKLIRAVERNHKSGGSVDDFSNLQSCIAAVKAMTPTGRKQ